MKTIVITLFAITLLGCLSKNITPECFLIPNGLTGKVTIFYNDPKGQNIEYRDQRRLFRIPLSSNLSTQFKLETGLIDQVFYYVDTKGKQTEILIDSSTLYYDNPVAKTNFMTRHKNDTMIMRWGIVGKIGNKVFQQFIIGTYLTNNSGDSIAIQ